MLYKNTKIKVRSQVGDTDFFDIVAGVLQGERLASYLFIICVGFVFRTSKDLMKENGFTLKKGTKQTRYHAQTDADYADNIALLANTPSQVESLLHSLEKTAGGIGLYVNADKMKKMF